ncbi:hypothetical protein BD324DRAFT_623673 [Kockovaella imperatae]|uniref:Uncharacterized protein n=1 Tax=Kockovaella imperatae TaxID=4999 RepID=A0A1Y1UK27_9TREE|nr:hypothetical protein BD324DRAFT_623673 [Kockovaella imperatae]ORX37887.1 hypothetical protein BD324DRAFT_623673 [Kockovaella imperatae]
MSRSAASLFASSSSTALRPQCRGYFAQAGSSSTSHRPIPACRPVTISCHRQQSTSRFLSHDTPESPLASSSAQPSPPAVERLFSPGSSSATGAESFQRRTHTPKGSNHATPLTTSANQTTTPEAAQKFLKDLLSLPPDRQFSPSLSIQIVTHKSYQWTNMRSAPRPQHYPRDRSTSAQILNLSGRSKPFEHPFGSAPLDDDGAWYAAHNGRLQFLGRRAIATYLPLFIHSSLRHGGMRLGDLDLLGKKTLARRIDDIRETANLGRFVGESWNIRQVMRSDLNQNAISTSFQTIQGSVVEAIVGAVFSEFGSPAAQRLFHSRVLPKLVDADAKLFADPYLREKITALKEQIKVECKGGFLIPSEGLNRASASASAPAPAQSHPMSMLAGGTTAPDGSDVAAELEEEEYVMEKRFAMG